MSTVTATHVDLDHPYRVAGILMILASFVILGFSLGVLNRCGPDGNGVCFDTGSHAAGDAGLVLFILFLIIGAALTVYSGATAYTTRTRTPDPVAPVTNVITPAAAPTPVTNVYSQAPAPAAAPSTVVVTPRS